MCGHMDKIHYVIGDIHGQSHALEALLDMIEAYHGLSYKGHPPSLVFWVIISTKALIAAA